MKGSELTYHDFNRWNSAKKIWKKGELQIESMSRLFDFFRVKKIDNYLEPSKAKQKEYLAYKEARELDLIGYTIHHTKRKT